MAKVTKRPHAALDLRFHDNPKVLAAGNAAIGLYARALAYCADYLTDGFVPEGWAEKEGKPRERSALARVGLWKPVDDGFLIPGYLVYNLSRAEVEATSSRYRELAKRRWDREKGDEEPVSLDAYRIADGNAKNGSAAIPDFRLPTSDSKTLAPLTRRESETSTKKLTEGERANITRKTPRPCINCGKRASLSTGLEIAAGWLCYGCKCVYLRQLEESG